MIDTVLVFEGQGARTIPAQTDDGEPIELASLTPAEAQTAIVRHQVARARPWRDRGTCAVMGQSLGEISALVVAGCLGLDDALALVHLRAELPAELVAPRDWTMASLTRVSPESATGAATDLDLWVIGANGPADCIVTGTADSFVTLRERLGLTPTTYRELPVVHPYHTPHMRPVADAMADALAAIDVADPEVPVISPTGPRAVPDAATARAVLVEALVSPVAWSTALACAASEWPDAAWRECGPSASLYRFVWKNGLTLDWAEA